VHAICYVIQQKNFSLCLRKETLQLEIKHGEREKGTAVLRQLTLIYKIINLEILGVTMMDR